MAFEVDPDGYGAGVPQVCIGDICFRPTGTPHETLDIRQRGGAAYSASIACYDVGVYRNIALLGDEAYIRTNATDGYKAYLVANEDGGTWVNVAVIHNTGGLFSILRGGNITFLAGKSLLNANLLQIDEITTPTAVPDHAQIYTKTDNKFYFQDGAGIEHEIAFA